MAVATLLYVAVARLLTVTSLLRHNLAHRVALVTAKLLISRNDVLHLFIGWLDGSPDRLQDLVGARIDLIATGTVAPFSERLAGPGAVGRFTLSVA